MPNSVKFYNFLYKISGEVNSKIIMLTGTPIMKNAFELSLYASILHNNILPEDI